MPGDLSHFEIPLERVGTGPIEVRGRSKPFARTNYSAHADFLRERAASLRHYMEEAADAEVAESVFLQVRTPEELPARAERQRLRNAGLEIVVHNGVLVQDHVEIKGTTVNTGPQTYSKHNPKEPLVLQDHSFPVSFRNVWIREL